ncbi:caspase-1-like [Culex pipiens pallens]|uniref:caspase-1-like n=1 Tax=Culex pipiens pallens TaxID=42434 RepID=UPI001953181A|nr:caspase-1-like [Culex pipiens pallens]
MNSGWPPAAKPGNGKPLYSDFFKFDFVDAKPSASRRNSDVQDASGYAERNNSTTAATVSTRSLPVELVPLPVPTRKGSTYLDTPTSPMSRVYAMNGAKRGKVLIFNQVEFDVVDYPERFGTHSDVERLYMTLPRLGFQREDISVFQDFSVGEIRREAMRLQVDKLEEADCLVVVILTHGEEGDYLMAQDDRYHLYEFIENFTPTALNSMAGKPKLFIVQACRGKKLDRGVNLRAKLIQADSMPKDVVDSQSGVFSYPEFADLMIVMSSHHGHYSFRNETGSWLIQELCNVIDSCDLEQDSIYDILTETNKRVAGRSSNADGEFHNKKQIPSFYSTLTRQLYFRPAQ